MDATLTGNEACFEEEPDWITDPYWQSQAFLEQLEKEDEDMSGLVYHPPTPFLSDAMLSAIGETLDLHDSELQCIHSALYDLSLRVQIARLNAPKIK